MKSLYHFIVIALIFCGSMTGCQNIDTTSPPVMITDSSMACFTKDVLPLYQANCAVGGCHDAQTRQNGYELSNYATLMRGITPNNPNASFFYTITASTDRKRMPPAPRALLTDAQRAIINKWISQGAKNTTCN